MLFRSCLLLFSLILVKRSNANCRSAVDIGIMLDSSTSVGEYQFNLSRQFSEAWVKSMNVSSGNYKVALMHFSRRTYLDFDFKAHDSSEDVAAAIRAIRYSPGTTSVDQAMEFAMNHVFVNETGMRPRQEAPVKILVIFTDAFIPLNAPRIGQVLGPYEKQETFILRLVVKTGWYYSEDLPLLVDRAGDILSLSMQKLGDLVDRVAERADDICDLQGY